MMALHRHSRLLLLAVVVGLMVVSVFARPAAASVCSGDAYADGSGWSDNYWVGWDDDGYPRCDTAGNYVLGIQWIDWGLNFRRSGVDGYYGSHTHQDVMSFQAYYFGSGSGSVDGLVGPSTWSAYRAQLVSPPCYYDSATGESWYQTPGYSYCGSARFKYEGLADEWYTRSASGTSWVRFSKYGPTS